MLCITTVHWPKQRSRCWIPSDLSSKFQAPSSVCSDGSFWSRYPSGCFASTSVNQLHPLFPMPVFSLARLVLLFAPLWSFGSQFVCVPSLAWCTLPCQTWPTFVSVGFFFWSSGMVLDSLIFPCLASDLCGHGVEGTYRPSSLLSLWCLTEPKPGRALNESIHAG